ncbi:MAG: cadherin-like beta sandwich domain-containing protein [Clostridia bacterium]|nr:cadherin-like beta sandwich domain-containing protein [Clostridia bacterium]
MKRFKTILSWLIATAFLILSTVTPATAANATLHFNSSSVQVGETFTVSVKISPGISMYAAEFSLSYNEEVLKYANASCPVNGAGGGIVKAAPTMTGERNATYQITFTALKAGSSTVSVSGEAYGRDDSDEVSFGASASMTVKDKDKEKSGNANLKSLSLSTGKLSPAFSSSRTSYTVTVPYETTKCAVYATAAEKDAEVSVSGSSTLSVGANKRVVTVTAPNGTQKNYTVTVTRQEEKQDTESSEETVSSEPAITDQDASVEIAGKVYRIATNLENVRLFKGFTAAVAEVGGKTVAVAQSAEQEYTLYYLQTEEEEDSSNKTSSQKNSSQNITGEDSEEPAEKWTPYLINGDGDWEKLVFLEFADREYIPAQLPEDATLPESYYPVRLAVQGNTVVAYATNEDMQDDFYYIYCFYNNSYGFYRYDSKDEILQRYPSLSVANNTPEEVDYSAMSFWQRFRSMQSNAKLAVLGLILVALSLIGLIAWVIVRIRSQIRLATFDDENLGEWFNKKGDEAFFCEEETNGEKEAPQDEDLFL